MELTPSCRIAIGPKVKILRIVSYTTLWMLQRRTLSL